LVQPLSCSRDAVVMLGTCCLPPTHVSLSLSYTAPALHRVSHNVLHWAAAADAKEDDGGSGRGSGRATVVPLADQGHRRLDWARTRYVTHRHRHTHRNRHRHWCRAPFSHALVTAHPSPSVSLLTLTRTIIHTYSHADSAWGPWLSLCRSVCPDDQMVLLETVDAKVDKAQGDIRTNLKKMKKIS
jgi:hypothetical protein